jgi:hypothetical protein
MGTLLHLKGESFAVEAAIERWDAGAVPDHRARLLASCDARLGTIAERTPLLPLSINDLVHLTRL